MTLSSRFLFFLLCIIGFTLMLALPGGFQV